MPILNDNFGQPEPAVQQEAALQRLKFMISQLPDMSVNLQPADELTPRVINIKESIFIAARQLIAARYDMMLAAYHACKEMDLPISDNYKRAFAVLVDDVIRLQETLRPAGDEHLPTWPGTH